MNDKIVGPMVAVATPFKEDFSIDYNSFEKNIRHMIERGVINNRATLLIGGAGGGASSYEYRRKKKING